MTEERRLTAIMFTDMVGYTALMGRDEARARELVERSRARLRSFVQRFGGRWLEEIGDGTLSVFPSAVEAVECTLAIQRSLESDDDLNLRIGIHLGDIVFADERVYGDGVNVAARIEPLAQAGGVAVSESVAQAVRGHPGMRLSYLGRKRLKNVDQPVRVYAISPSGEPRAAVRGFLRSVWARRVPQVLAAYALAAWGLHAGARWLVERMNWAPQWPDLLLVVLIALTPALVLVTYHQATRAGTRMGPVERIGVPLNLLAAVLLVVVFLRIVPIEHGRAATPTIAVLPLENLSGETEQDYLVDGLTDELIGAIGTLAGINVIARHSSFRYKGREYTLERISRELGATHVVEGSVRTLPDRIRVSVQLVETDDHVSRWSRTYERELTAANLFEIQKGIASSVANGLHAGFLATSRFRGETPRTDNLQAYQHFLKAQQSKRTGRSYTEVMHHIDRALELDPEFADAHAYRVVLTMNDIMIKGQPMASAQERIERHLESAVANDPQSPMVLWATFFWHNWNGRFEKAVPAIERAIELAPNWWQLYHVYSAYLSAVPFELERSLQMAEKAHALDPMNPSTHLRVIRVLQARGDMDAVEEELAALRGIHPDWPPGDWLAAELAWSRGRFAEALREMMPPPYGGVGARVTRCRLLADLHAMDRLAQCTGNDGLRRVRPADFVYWRRLQRETVNAEKLMDEYVTGSEPKYWTGYVNVPVALVQAGRPDLVPRYLDRMDPDWHESGLADVTEFLDHFRSLIYTSFALRETGDEERARPLIEKASSMRREIHWPDSQYAYDLAHADLILDHLEGKDALALDKFERRVRDRALANWVLFETDPAFGFLRKHPDYSGLLSEARAHADSQRRQLEQQQILNKPLFPANG